MKDYFLFSAIKTFVNNRRWLWVPYFYSLSGINLFWPNKGFETKDEAINYMKRHLNRIKQDYF